MMNVMESDDADAMNWKCVWMCDKPPIVIQYGRRKTSGMARAQVTEVEEVEITLVGTIVS